MSYADYEGGDYAGSEDQDLPYYFEYVKPTEFGEAYYQNPKYFNQATNSYVAYYATPEEKAQNKLTFGPGVLADSRLRKQLGMKTIKEGDTVPAMLIDDMAVQRWLDAVRDAETLRGQSPTRLPVAEMVYQMGLSGVKKFDEMLSAIDPETIREKALDSRWARQTPARAEAVARRLKEAAELEQPRPMRNPRDYNLYDTLLELVDSVRDRLGLPF